MVLSDTIAQLLLAAGALVFIGGSVFTIRALFRDRSRGQKRCPKCWYDMSGAPSLLCPECGRTARNERQLFCTRRRWRAAIASFMLMIVGFCSAIAPAVITGNGLKYVPTFILVRFYRPPVSPVNSPIPLLGRTPLVGSLVVTSKLDPVSNELGRRLQQRNFTPSQWRILLRRARCIQVQAHTASTAVRYRLIMNDLDFATLQIAARGRVPSMTYVSNSYSTSTWVGSCPLDATHITLDVTITGSAGGKSITLFDGAVDIPIEQEDASTDASTRD